MAGCRCSGRTTRFHNAHGRLRIDELGAARDAFARHAWQDASAGFRAVDQACAQLDGDDLERLAVCAYLVGKDEASSDAWARGHSEWLRVRNARRAARCTFWLALDLMIKGQRAHAHGWLVRTEHLLEDVAGGCAEQGLLLALTARLRIKGTSVLAAD